MVRDRLSDDAWEQIAEAFLPPAAVGRKRNNPREIDDGIVFVLRAGCPWRGLHEELACGSRSITRSMPGPAMAVLHRLVAAHIEVGEVEEGEEGEVEIEVEQDLFALTASMCGPLAVLRAEVKRGAARAS